MEPFRGPLNRRRWFNLNRRRDCLTKYRGGDPGRRYCLSFMPYMVPASRLPLPLIPRVRIDCSSTVGTFPIPWRILN